MGSGFGTFQAVYAMHETPATMLSEYVNHAHNDWLELWLEGGIPAAMLMAAFVILFFWQAARIWNPRGPYAPMCCHAPPASACWCCCFTRLVEYPLRMPALACIFALLLAIMLSSARKSLNQNAQTPPRYMSHRLSPTCRRQPPSRLYSGSGVRMGLRVSA